MDETQPLHSILTDISSAALRSANLTRQLLTFAHRQITAPKLLNLNDIVSDMLKMLHRLIGENIELSWIPGDNLGVVKIDPTQVDQILVNLCVNARDAISGVGNLTIKTQHAFFDDTFCSENHEFLPGSYVMLSLSDNGCGMDKETLSKVFEPFFTTKDKGKSTGLGLAVVYDIVKQNNGFINV